MHLFPSSSKLIIALLVALPVLSAPAVLAADPRESRPYVVVLDPGHGGQMHYGDESGAVSADGKLLEKNMTLEVAKVAAKDLGQMGYKVYLTRTRDQHVNTPPRDWNHDGKIDHVDEANARTIFANRHHADVFVSIHFDGSTDSSIRGTHGFYCPSRSFWRDSQRLATLLSNTVVKEVRGTGYSDKNGGVETDVADIVPQQWADYPWFLVLGPGRKHRVVATQMPGALIETLFMTSPRDDAAMSRASIISAIGQGYADGIRAYFNGHVRH
jgi:N-acetylmuramoyl-L-alanine amidase